MLFVVGDDDKAQQRRIELAEFLALADASGGGERPQRG